MKRFIPSPMPLHPLLIALYPVLALYATNLGEIDAGLVFRPALFSVVTTILLLFVLFVITRNWAKTSALTSLILITFFSYGHIYNLLKSVKVAGVVLGSHRIMGPLWIILLVTGTVMIMRQKREKASNNTLLNQIAAIAVIIPLVQIIWFAGRAYSLDLQARAERSSFSGELQYSGEGQAPDIYYIILDAYGREDLLKENFDLDVSPTLTQLEDIGFYVADCSQSNYGQTMLSLTSSLNMHYLNDIIEGLTPDETDRSAVEAAIRNNKVQQLLQAAGYETFTFETGFEWSELEGADHYVSPSDNNYEDLSSITGITEFEIFLIRTTAARVVLDIPALLPDTLSNAISYPNQERRNLNLYNLRTISNLPTGSRPKFVFAHLIIPHMPFVFAANGELVDKKFHVVEPDADNNVPLYKEGYREQLTYLNSRLVPMIEGILSNSKVEPIIILQGDHGPARVTSLERMRILNMYYLPGEDDSMLYPEVSPVNSFRIIFNQYFGTDYPILEDVSRYSTSPKYFDYLSVPNTCPEGYTQ
jgi:hypothetical protein